MKIFIALIFLISISEERENYCKKICQTVKNCIDICEKPHARGKSNSRHETIICGLDKSIKFEVNERATAEAHVYPWLVSMQSSGINDKGKQRVHTCNGVILNSRFILTAANCLILFENPEHNIKIKRNLMVGSFSLSTNNSKAIIYRPELVNELSTYIIHPNYNPLNLDNNIAIIKTERPIEFTVEKNYYLVNSVCFPDKDSKTVNGSNGLLVGWGILEQQLDRYLKFPDHLQNSKVLVLDGETCNNKYKVNEENEGWFCSYTDSHKMDRVINCGSGSPLVKFTDDHRAIVLGIISHQYKSLTIYTPVSIYVEWIENVIDNSYQNIFIETNIEEDTKNSISEISSDEIQGREFVNEESPEESTDKESTDEESTDEESTDEESTDKESTDEQSTDEESTDEQSTDEESTDEQSTDEQSTDEQSTDEESTDEESTDEESTDKESTDEESTDEESTDEESTDEESTVKSTVKSKIKYKPTEDPDTLVFSWNLW